MNTTDTPSTEPRWPTAAELAAHSRHTQITGAVIASGNAPMPSPAVKVPSGALLRLLHTIVDGNEQALLGSLHPNYADVEMLFACLRAQTPDVMDLRSWDEPTSIYKTFADDGLIALTFSEEFFANDHLKYMQESHEVQS